MSAILQVIGTRKYAREQTKWFRNEPSFQFVAANWGAPQLTEASVLRHVQCERREWRQKRGAGGVHNTSWLQPPEH